MKKLFTVMAVVLLTFIGGMTVNAQEVREIPIDNGWGVAWGDVGVSYSGGVLTAAINSSYAAACYNFNGPQDMSKFDKLCVELDDYNRWWGQIILKVLNGSDYADYASTVINMSMNGKTVTVPFDYKGATQVVQICLQGADINGNDPNPVIKIKRVYFLEAETDEGSWINWVPNGDCERDYAEGETPSLTGKNAVGDNAGAFFSTFEEGKGVSGSRGMVVLSSDNAKDEWDAQFFVSAIGHKMSAGEQYKFRMAAKSDAPANISSQGHFAPGGYKHWDCVGSFDLTTSWQNFERTGSIDGNNDGIWTIAFNLNNNKKLGTTFYFDNIEWWTNGPLWTGAASFSDGKPVQVVDKAVTASWEEGDIVKVWTDGKKGSLPLMSLTDESGSVVYAGASYMNENFVKFGITKNMLPLIQAGGIFALGGDVTMTKVIKVENKTTADLQGAGWIGDYKLNGGSAFVQVPSYEFQEVDLGYTVDLRFEGEVTVNDVAVTFGNSANGVTVSYAKEPGRFKVKGSSIKMNVFTEKELKALKQDGLMVSGEVTGANLRAIAVIPTLSTNSFNFIKMKIATGESGELIPENLDGANYLEITDEVDGNGGTGSGAKLTITPNLDASDYPSDVLTGCGFIKTEEGPLLRISGGYSGVTIKITKGAEGLKMIKFQQSNWSRSTKADKGTFDGMNGEWVSANAAGDADVTFTIKADTTWVCHSTYDKDGVYTGWERDEVILNDMGQWWIYNIVINPVEDLVINAPAGADIYEAYTTELAAMASLPKTITINLAAGGNYTISNPISLDGSAKFTLNGNDATVDADGLGAAFILMSKVPAIDAVKSGQYVFDGIVINDVNIKNMTKALIQDNGKGYAYENVTVNNSVVQYNTQSNVVFNFNSSMAITLDITNSTFWSKEKGSGNFIVMGGKRPWQITGHESVEGKFTCANNTFYNMAASNDKMFMNTNTLKGQVKYKFEFNSNIFYETSTLNKKIYKNITNNKKQVTTDEKNTYYTEGSFYNETDYNGDAGLTTDPGFASASTGDFTLSASSDQFKNKTGDPRWFAGASTIGEATAIEAVKTVAEDGAWYTIQGQRVAQPTKGLYIHNGRKVVIK